MTDSKLLGRSSVRLLRLTRTSVKYRRVKNFTKDRYYGTVDWEVYARTTQQQIQK